MPRYQSAYGIKHLPASATKLDVELAMYRWNDKFRKQSDKVWPANEHFINAVRMLWNNEQLTWNRWTEEHANCFVNDDFAIIWGPGSASKSNDFGAFVVADWWADPLNTYTAVCSTTAPMLKKRIWEAIQRYHGYHRGKAPGKHFASETNITMDLKETPDGTKKAGIHGFAVMAGTEAETQANIVGVHLPRVRLLVDEMQSTRRAAVEARHNLAKGASDSFKLFGLCNPDSFLNIAGEYSEPLAGWDSISVETEVWETKWGKVYHYDGHKSPAVLEENGAVRYPYLINQKQIDLAAKEGDDSAYYWIYVRGFPPPSGVSNTVMNEAECNAWDVRGAVTWRDGGRIRLATLDPAFGGVDTCCLKIWEGGYALNGVYTVELMETFHLQIRVGEARPPTFQIADQVRDYMEMYHVEPQHLAVDESVTQSVGEVIMEVWKKGLNRINFGGKPIEGLKSVDSNLRCENEYKNMISSLYLQFALYCKFDQIKGLDKDSIRQMCTRMVEEGLPHAIEQKKEYKKRMNRSPDDGDCCAMLAYLLRTVVGVIPGALQSGGSNVSISKDVAQHYDIDASTDNYLDTSL